MKTVYRAPSILIYRSRSENNRSPIPGTADFEIECLTDEQTLLRRVAQPTGDILLIITGLDPRTSAVCSQVRLRSEIPIIVVTELPSLSEELACLESGADDYLSSKSSERLIRARLQALLRRSEQLRHRRVPILQAGDLTIDLAQRIVRRHDAIILTTYVEFEILAALAAPPRQVRSRDELLTCVWGDSAYRDTRTVDVHIRHLREKIELNPKAPELILTVRGVGYRLVDPSG